MKITLSRTALVSGLGIVKAAASAKGLPILQNVALKATAKSLALTCTDLDTIIATTLDANVEQPGDCTVNAAVFHSLAHSLPGGDVCLETLTRDLKITCGTAKYKLGTLDLSEMPPVPEIAPLATITLPQATLRRLLSETSFCQGTDAARYVICGSHLAIAGTSVTAAATDGRRLATETATIEATAKAAASVIIPTKATRELLRLLADKDPKDGDTAPAVHITIGKAQAKFDIDGSDDCSSASLITKLIDGQYPDYRKVVPSDLTRAIGIARTELLRILERVNLIAEACTLEFKGQCLTVRARNTKGVPGEACETLLIPPVDQHLTVCFNARYLIDALESVEDDEVQLAVFDALSPAVFTVPSRSWLSVTMCMRLDDKAEKKPAAENAADPKPQPKAEPVAA